MYAFYILLFIAIILLWFGLSFLFKPLGKWSSKFFGDAINIMQEEESEDKE